MTEQDRAQVGIIYAVCTTIVMVVLAFTVPSCETKRYEAGIMGRSTYDVQMQYTGPADMQPDTLVLK